MQEEACGRRLATRRDVLSYASESAAAKNGDWCWNAHMPEKRQDGLSLAGLSWGMREIVSVAVQ